jgi:hypothetical protein
MLDDQYFTQTLLPDYLAENPTQTSGWDVVFDARGHFEEPHTKLVVPLGTLDVRSYLRAISEHAVNDAKLHVERTYPTMGALNRFGAILFVEKEGFMPLFRSARIAERYDLAIMSTKGLSVTASRTLVDRICHDHRIPLLVLHDFDKSGFSIVGTLQRDTRRFQFRNEIEVIDLGLRLDDVRKWELEDEAVLYGNSDPTDNLRENGATKEEIKFLCDGGVSTGYRGRRVELNAFTSADLIAWLEGKLKEYGVGKIVPEGESLEQAYRRALTASLFNRQVDELLRKAREEAAAAPLPDGLAKQLRTRLKRERARPWDEVLATIVDERQGGQP